MTLMVSSWRLPACLWPPGYTLAEVRAAGTWHRVWHAVGHSECGSEEEEDAALSPAGFGTTGCGLDPGLQLDRPEPPCAVSPTGLLSSLPSPFSQSQPWGLGGPHGNLMPGLLSLTFICSVKKEVGPVPLPGSWGAGAPHWGGSCVPENPGAGAPASAPWTMDGVSFCGVGRTCSGNQGQAVKRWPI